MFFFIWPFVELECVKLVHFQIEQGEKICHCAQLCDDTDYEQSVSESEWPGYKYMSIIKSSFANRLDSNDVPELIQRDASKSNYNRLEQSKTWKTTKTLSNYNNNNSPSIYWRNELS